MECGRDRIDARADGIEPGRGRIGHGGGRIGRCSGDGDRIGGCSGGSDEGGGGGDGGATMIREGEMALMPC